MKHLDTAAPPAVDDDVWAETVKDVKKIRPAEEKPSAPLIIGDIRPKIDYAAVRFGNGLERLELNDVDNIDRRTADKFRRGQFKIERRLDLHGLTEAEAHAAVNDFVRTSYLQKRRCILIITGKGLARETDVWYEKKGIIKEAVPAWLNEPELRPLILSFSQAVSEDGGEGAIYVLLRRQRNHQDQTT